MTDLPTHDSTTLATSHISRRGVLACGGAVAGMGLLASAGSAAGAAPGRTARVILDGKVFTGGPTATAEAVAIGTDGRIQAVGSTREIRRMVSRGTEVLDADNHTIMAGIHDGHMHPLGAAAASLNPSLHNAELTVPELQGVLTGFLQASSKDEPDGWLEVTDWSPVGLLPAGTVANRSILDALPTRRPVYLQGSDFHNSWVNTRALEIAGITRSTPNPPGGEIVRDANGDATGLLKDNAQGLVRDKIPSPSADELDAAYATMADYLLSVGIVAFQDAASGAGSVDIYAGLIGNGRMHQRVVPALVVDTELFDSPREAASELARIRRRHASTPGLRLTTAKVFVDGVMEFPAQTAALLTPYLDEDGKPTDNRGDLYIKPAQYRALAVAVDRGGWQLHSHAIGDRAVRTALGAYEAAVARNGQQARAHRHTITHLQLVHPDDLKRFATGSVLASMQLQWALRNQFTLAALRPYIGEERFGRLYPARSLERAGAHLVGGSDWPVDPLSPFNQIATAVDRAGASDARPLVRSEALSRAGALRMHTAGGAFQMHLDDAGTVAPGKRADLVVMDRDLLVGSTDRLRGAKVQHTLINGKVVYDASSDSARNLARRTAAMTATTKGSRDHSCCG